MKYTSDRTLSGLLEGWSNGQPDIKALISANGSLTFAELDARVGAFAQGLRQLGVEEGSVVGLMCTNRPEWVIAALAAIQLGARVCAFNTWAKKWDLQHMLRESRCQVLIALSQFRDTDIAGLIQELVPQAWQSTQPDWTSPEFPALRHIVLIGLHETSPGIINFEEVAGLAQADPRGSAQGAEPDRDDPIFVMYTSGSTARPKAVPVHRHVAIRHGRDVADRMGVLTGDVVWVPVPLFWSYGGANAFMVALVTGSTLVLQESFEAGEALQMIENHKCNVAYTLPNITDALTSHEAFSRARVVTLGKGMTIGSPRDIKTAGLVLGIEGICNAYGSTELYGGCAVTPHDWPMAHKMATQGPPLPGNSVIIRNQQSGQSLPVGEAGEICVTGQVTSGYIDQPEQTRASFSEQGEFRSGDLGFLDEKGDLHFVGRASEMIRSAGINIAPAEIEEFLGTHPKVAEVALVGVPDDAKGEQAVAFVSAGQSAGSIDEAELKAFCKDQIASYKIPARIAIVAEPLPRTDTGKLSRNAVRELAREFMGKAG